MKIQKRLRLQILIGLGAALLTAGSVRAQQDIDPTFFDVNPGGPTVNEEAVMRAALHDQAKIENAAARDSAAVVSGDSTLESAMTRMAIVDAGVALVLFGGIISIVLYAMAATRREHFLPVQRGNAAYTPFLPRRLNEGRRRQADLRESRYTPPAIPGDFLSERELRSLERRKRQAAFLAHSRQNGDARSRFVPGT